MSPLALWPLDLPGPEFLGLYVAILATGGAVAWFLRRRLRQPDDLPHWSDVKKLDPYEVAWLAGGEKMAVNAAIASLLHSDVFTVDATSRELSVGPAILPRSAHRLEREVAASRSVGKTLVGQVRAEATKRVRGFDRNLRALGYLCDAQSELSARVLPGLVLASIAFLGVAKAVVGASRGRPIGFLIVLIAVAVVLTGVAFFLPTARSRTGDQALEVLKERNAALGYGAKKGWKADDTSDLVLAFGLFGPAILVGSEYDRIRNALAPPAGSSTCGSGSSCGSSCGSGCGGGGCGGGCGGCGG